MADVAIWNAVIGSCVGLAAGAALASSPKKPAKDYAQETVEQVNQRTVYRLLRQTLAAQYQSQQLTPLAHRLAYVLGIYEWPENLDYWLDFPNVDLHLQALKRMTPPQEKKLHRCLEQQSTIGLLQAFELAVQKRL